MARCGSCKTDGVTVAHVRECYGARQSVPAQRPAQHDVVIAAGLGDLLAMAQGAPQRPQAPASRPFRHNADLDLNPPGGDPFRSVVRSTANDAHAAMAARLRGAAPLTEAVREACEAVGVKQNQRKPRGATRRSGPGVVESLRQMAADPVGYAARFAHEPDPGF